MSNALTARSFEDLRETIALLDIPVEDDATIESSFCARVAALLTQPPAVAPWQERRQTTERLPVRALLTPARRVAPLVVQGPVVHGPLAFASTEAVTAPAPAMVAAPTTAPPAAAPKRAPRRWPVAVCGLFAIAMTGVALRMSPVAERPEVRPYAAAVDGAAARGTAATRDAVGWMRRQLDAT